MDLHDQYEVGIVGLRRGYMVTHESTAEIHGG